MNKPTEEQNKEFWEWCELTPELDLGELMDSEVEVYKLPQIDLNNLFKYAVPEVLAYLEEKYPDEIDWRHYALKIFYQWLSDVLDGKDSALALFWALWEVIEDSKEVKR